MYFNTKINPFLQALLAMLFCGIAAFVFLLLLIWAGSFLAYQEKLARAHFKTEQTPTEKEEHDC